MAKRIQWVDISKGIGILLVIYGHALGGIINALPATRATILSVPYNIIYGFHMPLFFFLSGIFAVKWVQRNFRLALHQKVVSLVIPYFVWTIITGTIMALAQKYTNSGLGVRNILISPIAPFSEYWFLYVLFFIFLVYYIGNRIIGANGLLILSVILFLMRPLIYKYWILDAFSLNFVFFCIGTKFFTLKKFWTIFQYTKFRLFLVSVLFIVINILYLKVIGFNNYLYISYSKALTVSCGILLTVYLAQLVEKVKWLSACLVWLGQASMAVYVMHLIPIAGSRIFALRFLHINNLVVLSFIISIIALIACLIGYYLIEHTKYGPVIFGEQVKNNKF